jgi:ABC-type uncharacterized transport system fused permease/ATPase subunit
MGASGSGKTSLLRAIAGLWTSGSGTIRRYTLPIGLENKGAITEESVSGSVDSSRRGNIFFLPQKPYMVLGTLRQQLLYPTWNDFSTTQEPSDGKGICHSQLVTKFYPVSYVLLNHFFIYLIRVIYAYK